MEDRGGSHRKSPHAPPTSRVRDSHHSPQTTSCGWRGHGVSPARHWPSFQRTLCAAKGRRVGNQTLRQQSEESGLETCSLAPSRGKLGAGFTAGSLAVRRALRTSCPTCSCKGLKGYLCCLWSQGSSECQLPEIRVRGPFLRWQQ